MMLDGRTGVIFLMVAVLAVGCGAATEPEQPVETTTPAAESEPRDEVVDEPADPDDELEVVEQLPEIDPEAAPKSTHHRLQLKGDEYIGASVEVRIDEVPTHGLRFFALQVNFDDVWAHGGLQRDPSDGRANWGGLVRGIDYDFEGAEQEVLARIQNVEGRSRAASWEGNTWYRYEISRGELEELPPGEYSVLSEEPVVVESPREMWRWNFRIVEVDTEEVVWEHHLFVAQPFITSGTYWTETGYGMTCTDKLTVQWRNPYFHSMDGELRLPQAMNKSMAQSTCPDFATTDMARADNGGEWGTTQWYGVERASDSEHGDLLYYWTLPR